MKIRDYQTEAHRTARYADLDVYVFGLIGEAGEIASAVKQAKSAGASKEVLVKRLAEEIGDLFWYAAEIATAFDVNLEEVLASNLDKVRDLFEHRDVSFDTSTVAEERFPQAGVFRFEPKGDQVIVTLDGNEFGNPLDDNSHRPDGYRYHDIFHITYMVKLGWSPVMRKLLKRKRKEGAGDETDRVEDGARAAFLEEGITALIFSQSDETQGISLFSDPETIPFSLVNTIKRMTSQLEVRARPVTAWRDAIAEAFQLFDELCANEGGEIRFDIATQSLSFEARR